MAEIITLNTAVQVDAGATVFRIALIVFDWEHALIKIHLRQWNAGAFVPDGKRVTASYEGAEATTLMTQLNKVNLSTAGNSLHQRVIARLLADGKLPSGNASGSPD